LFIICYLIGNLIQQSSDFHKNNSVFWQPENPKSNFFGPHIQKEKNCLKETLSLDYYYHRTLASLTLIYSFQKCRKFQIYIIFKGPNFVKGIREH